MHCGLKASVLLDQIPFLAARAGLRFWVECKGRAIVVGHFHQAKGGALEQGAGLKHSHLCQIVCCQLRLTEQFALTLRGQQDDHKESLAHSRAVSFFGFLSTSE